MDERNKGLARNNKLIIRRNQLPMNIRFAGEFYGSGEAEVDGDHVLSKKEREYMFVFSDADVLEVNEPELHILVFLEEKSDNVPLSAKDKLRTILKHLKQGATGKSNTRYKTSILSYSKSHEIREELQEKLREREQAISEDIAVNKDRGREAENNKNGKRYLAMADNYLKEAMEYGASDFHIEADASRAFVRLRIHKQLIDIDEITHHEAAQLGVTFYSEFTRGRGEGQVKGIAEGTYHESSILDAEFSRKIGGNISLKARMVNIGLNHSDSFNIVLRLIDKTKTSEAIPFEKLNFSRTICRKLRILDTASKGAILVVGVTGSGKTTTLQNMIQHERDRTGNTRKIYSIEQPVETHIDRVVQINATSDESKDVSADKNFSFDNINRSLMRGDPDSIMYGEIRDVSTAIALQMGANSGHLVYGTMHVKSAIDAFPRLESFGLSREIIARNGFLVMIMCLHLLPLLCPHCSIPYKDKNSVPERYSEFDAIANYRKKRDKRNIMRDVIATQKSIKPGDSLLRELQCKSLIDSQDVFELQQKIKLMNEGRDNVEFIERVETVIRGSMMPREETNVRFKGPGCDQCFNGTVGVVPVGEIIIPDETFLSFVREGRLSRAELYWKSNLDGITITQDSYEKIVSGMIDPRDAETELPELLGS
ncbi:ATPase, T2SS/T4P/T4SS family [Alteromonas sp. 14N.309.X.WAT.G.H12]|uniref:ATPase, T2SS/T4P/T4SS family n=1 Tax=Alteromonas sp. 14N.309.X.WAT.G.H12 TaxID=3120824 RepID=UPI002FD15C16